ncbi:chaplin family protein [Streptomyces sp. A5-4]|uniref:chaplin n=1 Tax=Streptomyces sp. A5-4 TaxID=3384771 RepID=UPI003DAA4A09
MRQVLSKGVVVAAAASGVLAMSGGYAHADADASGATTHSPGVLSGNSVQAPVHVPVNACGNTVDVVGALNPAFGNKCANVSSGRHGNPGHHGNSGHQGSPGHHGDSSGHDNGYGDEGGSGHHGAPGHHGGGSPSGSAAHSETSHSPGVLSGNAAQVPLDVPVNVCGNSVDVVGLLNPAFGNECANGASTMPRDKPPSEEPPAEEPPSEEPPAEEPPSEEPVTEEPPSEEPRANEPHADNKPQEHGLQADAEAPALAETGAGQVGTAVAIGAALLGGGFLLARRGRVTQS